MPPALLTMHNKPHGRCSCTTTKPPPQTASSWGAGAKLGKLALVEDTPPPGPSPKPGQLLAVPSQHINPSQDKLGALLAPPPRVLPLLTCGPLEAQAVVGVVPVLAGPPVSAGLALALIDVDVAAVARVAGLADAGEGSDAVLAGPIVARVRVALINVNLTVYT